MKYLWITVLAASLAAQTIDVGNGDESTALAEDRGQKGGDIAPQSPISMLVSVK